MSNNNQKYDITWVGLLEIRNRKVLMTREKDKTIFQLPGGGQEKGETHSQTLIREVHEELGLSADNITLYDDFILPGRHEGVMIRFLIYKADLKGEMKAGEEIEKIEWIDSNYEKRLIDIGNAAKLKLFPRLLTENLID